MDVLVEIKKCNETKEVGAKSIQKKEEKRKIIRQKNYKKHRLKGEKVL